MKSFKTIESNFDAVTPKCQSAIIGGTGTQLSNIQLQALFFI